MPEKLQVCITLLDKIDKSGGGVHQTPFYFFLNCQEDKAMVDLQRHILDARSPLGPI